MMFDLTKRAILSILLLFLVLLCLSPFYDYFSAQRPSKTSHFFRKCGDLSHQIAIALLIVQLIKAKNARGISVKTQELRLLVFVTRYLDLVTRFYSFYNSAVKIVYICATAFIIYMIKVTEPYKTLYNANQDSFPAGKGIVLPCVVLSFFIHLSGSGFPMFTFMEWAWTFSIMLESVAILPQLAVLREYRLVENLTGKFMFFLGMYRVLYILDWVVMWRTDPWYRLRPLVFLCGTVQTFLYINFYYQFCRLSRFTRRCKRDQSEENSTDDDEMEDLIFEGEQEVPAMRPTMQNLLSEKDSSLVVLEESTTSPEEIENGSRQRNTTLT